MIKLTILHYTLIAIGAAVLFANIWVDGGAGIVDNTVMQLALSGYLVGVLIMAFPWELVKR